MWLVDWLSVVVCCAKQRMHLCIFFVFFYLLTSRLLGLFLCDQAVHDTNGSSVSGVCHSKP